VGLFGGMTATAEEMYPGTCDVFGYISAEGVINNTIETKLHSGIPCRLYRKSTSVGNQGDANTIHKEVRLLINPKYLIPAGSKIVVTQHGRSLEYENSGEADIYESHQSIVLKLARKRA